MPDYCELNEKDMICKSNNINIGKNTDDVLFQISMKTCPKKKRFNTPKG